MSSKPDSLLISDLHLGSRYFLADLFERFINSLPPNTELILNGDVVDRVDRELRSRHQAALDRLVAESQRRRVVWVKGNHDELYEPPSEGQFEIVTEYAIDKRLFIAHGNYFDNVMPHHRWFIQLFRSLHHLRILLGAEAVHVAYYAKRFPRLYQVLRRHVWLNAVEHARENGFAAVACGHTHQPENRMIDGIHYFNTGSWTEQPVYALAVFPDRISLNRVF